MLGLPRLRTCCLRRSGIGLVFWVFQLASVKPLRDRWLLLLFLDLELCKDQIVVVASVCSKIHLHILQIWCLPSQSSCYVVSLSFCPMVVWNPCDLVDVLLAEKGRSNFYIVQCTEVDEHVTIFSAPAKDMWTKEVFKSKPIFLSCPPSLFSSHGMGSCQPSLAADGRSCFCWFFDMVSGCGLALYNGDLSMGGDESCHCKSAYGCPLHWCNAGIPVKDEGDTTMVGSIQTSLEQDGLVLWGVFSSLCQRGCTFCC